MMIYSGLFILGIAACALSEKCPSYEEIAPCACEDMADTGNILVYCNDDTITLKEVKQALNSLSGKKDVEIELDGLTLGTIPSNFFEGIGVTRLDITHCELDALTEDASQPPLFGLEDTLEELLILSSFSEEKVPAKLKLGHLKKLRDVDLSYNTIKELSNDWFDKEPASLENLIISNNGIEKLGDRAFANLVNLREFSLDGNRFGNIRRSMLPSSANRLNTLELDNNDLTDLPEDLFSSMPSLDVLSLRTNGVTRLEQNTFEPIWEQLYALYLQGNPLVCDSHMNWIFSLRAMSIVYGTCEAPSNQKGKKLQDFIESNSQ